jgi:succinate dehydrogenase/fumarate reductase flavoprotein subunit
MKGEIMNEKVERAGHEDALLSRRDALKGAALAGLGVLGMGMLSACGPSDGDESSGGSGATTATDISWDKEVDVAVIGSGTVVIAAIAASELGSKSVLIAEKDPVVFGGTSSTSGGGHALALLSWNADEGISDTRENVVQYMKESGSNRMDSNVIEAFVDTCDEYAHWVADLFGWSKWGHINKAFGDYYELYKDALANGFGHGSWYPFDADGMPLMAPQQWPLYREYVDTHNNIELMMGTIGTSLITDANGAVVGVTVNDGSQDINVKATAVILGTGGFEHDETMRRLHLPFPYYRSNGSVNNTGDAQRMGAKIGARLAYMDETFGCPHIYMNKDFTPGEFSYDQAGSDAFAPRGFPHSIMVNRKGRRFHDEATMYATATRAFGVYDTGTMEFVNIPAFWIADSNFAETFILPGNANAGENPDFVFTFNSLEELADGMGIDKAALLDEVATFNQHAAQGSDPLWLRGKPNSDSTLAMMGAYRLVEGATLPTSCLGVVDKPPFYCCRYVPGMMGGTRGGLHFNENAQVLDVSGDPIPGLYATGNCSSGVAAYWAGGATLGQGTVMAYRAAKHISGA